MVGVFGLFGEVVFFLSGGRTRVDVMDHATGGNRNKQ
jgi:hypothetical protein